LIVGTEEGTDEIFVEDGALGFGVAHWSEAITSVSFL
jgi:hypothetical protein